MREIKFRAWNKAAKVFVDDVLITANKHGFLYQNYNKCEFMGEDRDIVLMQYTGLKDKNGKEIYEGDVFQFGTKKEWKSGEGERGIVEWHKKLARFGLTFYSIYGGEGYTGKVQHLVDFIEGLKIIGNIYENPELTE